MRRLLASAVLPAAVLLGFAGQAGAWEMRVVPDPVAAGQSLTVSLAPNYGCALLPSGAGAVNLVLRAPSGTVAATAPLSSDIGIYQATLAVPDTADAGVYSISVEPTRALSEGCPTPAPVDPTGSVTVTPRADTPLVAATPALAFTAAAALLYGRSRRRTQRTV